MENSKINYLNPVVILYTIFASVIGILNWIIVSVEFEGRLWFLDFQASRLIRWARRYPNDHNLGNLILFRHQLRQAIYRIESASQEDESGAKNRTFQRIIENATSTISRLELAIAEIEDALN